MQARIEEDMGDTTENTTETRESGTELDDIVGDDCSSSQQLHGWSGDCAETLTNGHTTPGGYDTESVDRGVCGPNGEDSNYVCDDVVFGLLEECLRAGSVALNLSRKGLQTLPEELFHHFQHLEYLYLEGNELEVLPDEFFGYFPRLKWLDLRNNRLKSIPSAHLLEHLCLRTILLERNELRTLPPELGSIRSLDGLNIRCNSLEFPPAEIIAKGTKKLLSYLRHLMRAKSHMPEPVKLVPEMVEDNSETAPHEAGQSRAISGSKSRIVKSEEEPDSETECSSTDSHSLSRSASHSAAVTTKLRRHRGSRSRPVATAAELGGGGFSTASATSLRCLSVNSSGHRLDKKYISQSEKYVKLPEEPVSEDKVRQTFVEEKRRARVRKTKIKQDEIIQNLKDQDMIKGWREEAKRLQAKKMSEKRAKGFIDYVEAATAAPFGVSDTDLKVMTNSERIAQRMSKNMKNENQPRPMSPGTMQRLQEIRDEKERLLRDKVRLHTEHMRARRARSIADPLEEMKAAQNEIEIAKQLQKEIEMRRKELEYRFTAHAVDAIDAAGPRTRYTRDSAKR